MEAREWISKEAKRAMRVWRETVWIDRRREKPTAERPQLRIFRGPEPRTPSIA